MASFGGRWRRIQKILRVSGFGFGHLDVDAAGGERVTVHAQGGQFARHEWMKARRFEPGADELRVGWTQGGEDGGEVHDGFLLARNGFQTVGTFISAKTMTPAPVWSRVWTCTSTCWPMCDWPLLTTTMVPSGR